MASLTAICKKRILEEMIAHAAGAEKNYIVLVVDQNCLRVLSSCCGVYDILEDGVTLVELLEKRRQPLPELHALYFISASEESVEAVLQDFADERNPQYKAVHVFFSSLPGSSAGRVLQQFASCAALLPRLRTFAELNLDFVVQEQRVFHFDSPLDFVDLYLNRDTACLEEYANRLYTLCASLGEVPEVRFQKNLRGLSQQLATLVNERLSRASFHLRQRPRRQSSTGSSGSSGSSGGSGSSGSVLLIVDRSVDVCALLLHEYTYQALAYDLLQIPTSAARGGAGAAAPGGGGRPDGAGSKGKAAAAGKSGSAVTTAVTAAGGGGGGSDGGGGGLVQQEDIFEYEVVNNAGRKEKKQAVLGEQDALWVRFRHQHVQHVNQEVQDEIQKFIQENATAKMQKSSATQGATLQAIRALPQYQEMLARYWEHVTLSEKCFDQLQARGIMKVGLLEQSLACGVEKDGKEVSHSKLYSALTENLLDRLPRAEEKVRLVLLYFLQICGLTQAERIKVMEMAQLSLASQQCVQRFLQLDIEEDDVEGSLSTAAKHTHRLSVDKEKIKYFKKRAKHAEYELSRFEPCLKLIMEKALQGELHGGNFPFVEERGHTTAKTQLRKGSSTTDQAIGRATEWDWSFGWTAPPSAATSPQHSEGTRERLIVFVLGGVTHSEMRSAYTVSKELGADVFLGGSCILTPPMVLKLLKDAGPSPAAREKK